MTPLWVRHTVSSVAQPLTPKQVAERFGVTVSAVADWANTGKLAYFRTPGGHRRFRVEDVESFIASFDPQIKAVGE